VNRGELQQLAEDRVHDAAALLSAGRWSAAYYLAGYAVECGLKACIMAHVERTGIIFEDKKYGEKCWTHDLDVLATLAGIEAALKTDSEGNVALTDNWTRAKRWRETSRYEQKTQEEAQFLYDAITNDPNGILTWIRRRW
jgi:HEPN domain-containing protein